MLFSGDQRSFCIIGDALRTIGIDTTLYIEENRIPSRFWFAGDGGPSPSRGRIQGLSVKYTGSGACHVGVYRSPDTFWVPFVQFTSTFATVHN